MANPKESLAWYVNETLSEEERAEVTAWADADEKNAAALAGMQTFARRTAGQVQMAAPAFLAPWLEERWWTPARKMAAVLIGLSFGLLLWMVVQPGIRIEWQSTPNGSESYSVIRINGQGQEQVLEQIPATAGSRAYEYTDALVFPFQKYTYVIEAHFPNGATVRSPMVSGQAVGVLWGQMALALSGLIFGILLVQILRGKKYTPQLVHGLK